MKPAIGDDGDVVVWRHRFKHGDSESNTVLIFCVSLTKHEGVMEEDDFSIYVFNHDPKRFRRTVHFLVPAKVRRDGQINAKEGASDRLNLSRQPMEIGYNDRVYVSDVNSLELREIMDETMNQLSGILNTNKFANLRRILPTKVRLAFRKV